MTTALLMKIGGRTSSGSVGIHGRHLDEGSRSHYISTDTRRQVIPVVYYTDDQGKNRGIRFNGHNGQRAGTRKGREAHYGRY